MATNINFGTADETLQVQEDIDHVLFALRRGNDYVKLTRLRKTDKQPLGDVWVNPDFVRFVNPL
jgi:hypothetical protein